MAPVLFGVDRAARAFFGKRLEGYAMRIWPGRPYPLGATFDGQGVNFALFSENATKVELCLFDEPGLKSETHCVSLSEQTDLVWHGYLPDVEPGQLYGYRVHGPYGAAGGSPI